MDSIDNKNLYENQKDTLDKFLERNAITKEQYDKSLKVLKERFGIDTGVREDG